MNADFGSHFPEEVLEKYAMRQLSLKNAAPLEEHLLICPTCQNRFGAIDEYIQVVRAASAFLHDRYLRYQFNVHTLPRRVRKSALQVRG